MTVFKRIKEAVSVKDAAIFYGMKVSGTGMCLCPFHNERHPSMKVDVRFHCFACGEDGDVIDFVGKLFSLSPSEAAKKMINDFNLPIDYGGYRIQKKDHDTDASEGTMDDHDFEELVDFAISVICDFHRHWWKVREEELPDQDDDEWSEHFCKAVNNVNLAKEWLRILENGEENEKHELLSYLCKR